MKKFFAIIGIAIGLWTMISGIIMLDMYTGRSPSSASFGADFYSYIYEATDIAATNIKELGEVLRRGVGYIMISMGLTEICAFVLVICNDKNKHDNQPVTNYSPVIPLSQADELLKFKNLLDDGSITSEEYELKKSQLLGL